jgi:hypothetical protein
MKKLLFVLAIVAVYGLSISQVSAQKVTTSQSKVTVVTDSKASASVDKDKKVESTGVAVEKPAGCCAGKTAADCPMKMEGAGCAGKATGEASGAKAGCAGQQTSTGKK